MRLRLGKMKRCRDLTELGFCWYIEGMIKKIVGSLLALIMVFAVSGSVWAADFLMPDESVIWVSLMIMGVGGWLILSKNSGKLNL